MKDFIVKTNFGHTYLWTPEQIAQDYALTAIQWQDEEDIENPMTEKELYDEILLNEKDLQSWYGDQIEGDHRYAYESAELIEIDQEKFKEFLEFAIINFGEVVF